MDAGSGTTVNDEETGGVAGSGSGSSGRKKPRGSAKDRAVLLLSVRWRSRQELDRRLRSAGFEAADVEVALEDLEQAGLIEDRRFAHELVHDQAARRLAGNRAIRSSLLQKGVAREIADAALDEAGDEEQRAHQLAVRRAERLRGLQPEAAFRRLYGFLLRRGYGPGTARDACRAALKEISGEGPPDEPP